MSLLIDGSHSMKNGFPDLEGKNFWIRTVAYLIDSIVLFGINFITGIAGGVIFGIVIVFVKSILGIELYVDEEQSVLELVVSLIISIIYFGLFEGLYGATFAKLILRMRVISCNGEPCSLLQAFDRSVLRIIDGILFGLVAYINMKPPTYQRLGDKRAQTIVVSAKAPFIKKFQKWWKFVLAFLLFLLFSGVIQMMVMLYYIRID